MAAAAGSKSLPPYARHKGPRALRELLFGGSKHEGTARQDGHQGREPLYKIVRGYFDRKKFLLNQRAEARTQPSQRPPEALPHHQGRCPGNWGRYVSALAGPTGLAIALGATAPSHGRHPPLAQPAVKEEVGAEGDGEEMEEARKGNGAEEPSGDPPGDEGRAGTADELMCHGCYEPMAGREAAVFPCGHMWCGRCHSRYAALKAAKLSHGAGGKGRGHLRCFLCQQRFPASQITCTTITAADRRQSLLVGGEVAEGRGGVDRARKSNAPAGAEEAALASVAVTGEWLTKLEALLRRLLHLRHSAPEEKSLVFSQFPEALALVGRALQDNGLRHVKLEAGRKNHHRRALETFNTDPECRVFLLSLRAGGAGLTLVAASNVFLLEPALDPGIAQQAIARVHRIGQSRPVTITRFVVQGSVEAEVQRVQEAQQALLQDEEAVTSVVTSEAHDPALVRGLLQTVCK